jgi:hypothetical protein
LERVAEPLAALVPGFEWPEAELQETWRLLLWNGAHDSVCGCSVDEVATAVDMRYQEAGDSARDVALAAMRVLADRMASDGLVVFNPSPFERYGIPGLGWKVKPTIPVEDRIDIQLEDGRFVAGDIAFRLVDETDVGDLYNFCPTTDGPPALPTAVKVAARELIAEWDGLRVTVRASRRPGDTYVRLWGSIQNQRPDHRLRLHVTLHDLPTGSVALSPFEIVQRPIASEGGTETPSRTWPTRGAVLAGDLAVFEEGVFEYEAIPDSHELAITLLRSVGTISRPEISTRSWAAGPDIATPNAQMIGEQRFSVSAIRDVRPEDLPSTWERLQLFPASEDAPGGGDLPDTGSLLDIEGAELSSVRKVDGHIEVRIWNPSKEPREVRVAGRTIRLGPARIETIRLD